MADSKEDPEVLSEGELEDGEVLSSEEEEDTGGKEEKGTLEKETLEDVSPEAESKATESEPASAAAKRPAPEEVADGATPEKVGICKFGNNLAEYALFITLHNISVSKTINNCSEFIWYLYGIGSINNCSEFLLFW